MKVLLQKLLRLRPEHSESKRPKVLGPADPWMTATLIGLVALGVVMVYSASAVFAAQRYDNSLHFLVRQAFFAVAGVGTMFAIARIDYHRYRVLTYPGLFVAIAMLVFVAIGFGRSAGGAARWIAIGPFNIQPAEPTKVMLILWLAYSLSKKREQMASFSIGFLPHVLMAGFLMLLCLKQPDFGSAIMIGALTFVMLFTAGARLKNLVGTLLIFAPMAAALVLLSPYRMRRIQAFLNPFEHRQDVGYHITQSFMSFGAGGVTGVGIGDSRQKLLFLPEAHTDFISAIIGEELGFVGILLLIGAFVFIVIRGLRAAGRAADDYGSYLAVGITVFIGIQALTNLSVAMGLVPTKGLVLPFISYGGSSLLVNCAAAGILLNVSRPRQPVEWAATGEGDVGDDEKQPVPQGRRPRRNRKPGEASIKVREGRAR
ncbi:MAG: putative lipid II flippase FtsW [Polyangiales bacterium]